MCKLYIETSDLDNAIAATLDDSRNGAKGSAIQALNSGELAEAVEFSLDRREYAGSEAEQTEHVLTLGILIGLKLAESGLELDVAAYSDGLVDVA